jgi:hypothetical protein
MNVPTINRLPVLPYWPVYAEWIDHLTECRRCSEVVVIGSGEIKDLCSDGRILQTALEWDISQQREAAALN